MKHNIEFSVIVLIYNAKLSSILMTINSILKQQYGVYEIIIADDASSINYSVELNKYLQSKDLIKYRIINNFQNVGTVQNLRNALKYAKGRYVKALGAGDLLYSENTLFDMYRFLKKEKALLGFGLAQKFFWNKRKICIKDIFNAPNNIRFFKTGKCNYFLKMLDIIVSRDWISGSCIFGEKDTLKKYLDKLIGKSKYSEDVFQLLVFCENEDIVFMDKPIVWYEYGTGISTNGNSKIKKVLEKDIVNIYKKAIKEYQEDKLLNIMLRIGMKQDIWANFIRTGLYYYNSFLSSIVKRKTYNLQGYLYNKNFIDEVWEAEAVLTDKKDWKKVKMCK